MKINISTDVGYGVRIKQHEAEGDRPAGYVVEIHFYNKQDAVRCATEIISMASSVLEGKQ